MLEILIVPFVNALLFLYGIIGENFGLAIIFFTLVVRLATYPFTSRSMKSAQAMQELQNSKEYKKLQKKYKDDAQKMQQEQLKLWKEKGVNPLSSCLPTVLQTILIIPVYYAVSRASAATPLQVLQLFNDTRLPNVSQFIPLNSQFLWMDLSQPERFELLGYGVPILAIIVAATTYLQSKLMTPTATTGSSGDQAAAMGQSMTLMMPLMIGYFAYVSPAGLALYFFVGNIVGIIQAALMGRLDWRNLIPGQGGKGAKDAPAKGTKDSKPSKQKAKKTGA